MQGGGGEWPLDQEYRHDKSDGVRKKPADLHCREAGILSQNPTILPGTCNDMQQAFLDDKCFCNFDKKWTSLLCERSLPLSFIALPSLSAPSLYPIRPNLFAPGSRLFNFCSSTVRTYGRTAWQTGRQVEFRVELNGSSKVA